MREIKFRAWDEGNKIMHYNFQWMDSGNGGSDWIVFKSDKQLSFPDAVKNPFFAQQLKKMAYTGLKDKKGIKIYHKDYVLSGKKRFIVEWQQEEARFLLLPCLGNTDNWKFMDEVSRMVVDGNIFETIVFNSEP